MHTTSEYVTLGHPDRCCDFISSYILDRYLEADPLTRYALEVQMKDNHVRLGGEITSAAKFTKAQRASFVTQALIDIGYSPSYVKLWGEENVPNVAKLNISEVIGEQSPDIAQGVNADGWGDQGIFWGMAERAPSRDNMPLDYWTARQIGEVLYTAAKSRNLPIGIDIKTQVEVTDGKVSGVIIAAPCRPRDFGDFELDAAVIVRNIVGRKVKNLIVNGTGAYVRHGSVGDCGTTGRKLVVDFYGGNCRIGGGSPWTKDGTKADVALNIYARVKAVEAMHKYGVDKCYVGIAACIGRKEITVTVLDANLNEIAAWSECRPAGEVIEELGLRRPVFAAKCQRGLFA